MPVLYFLSSLRNPVCDVLFSAVTYFGHEALFIALFLFLFWCRNRNLAYYTLLTCMIGMVLNLVLKISFRIPRPWVLDPAFSIVENARAAASGYSFPSGHTQCAVTAFGALFLWCKDKRIRGAALFPILLVPISRMYLGVHTPLDVSVSFVLALVLLVLLLPFLRDFENQPKTAAAVIGFLILLALGALIYVTRYPFPADTDAENLAGAVKNACRFFGISLALLPGYFVCRRITADVLCGKWYVQLLKIVSGLLLVLAVRTVLKAPLTALCGNAMTVEGILCFLMALTAMLYPLSFPFFAGIGKKKQKGQG